MLRIFAAAAAAAAAAANQISDKSNEMPRWFTANNCSNRCVLRRRLSVYHRPHPHSAAIRTVKSTIWNFGLHFPYLVNLLKEQRIFRKEQGLSGWFNTKLRRWMHNRQMDRLWMGDCRFWPSSGGICNQKQICSQRRSVQVLKHQVE